MRPLVLELRKWTELPQRPTSHHFFLAYNAPCPETAPSLDLQHHSGVATHDTQLHNSQVSSLVPMGMSGNAITTI